MRRIILILLYAFGLTSCVDMFRLDNFGKTRSQLVSPGRLGQADTSDVVEAGGTPVYDTLLLVCGVHVPPGYDWQKDTAIGLAQGQIVLYKDMKQAVSFPTGYDENVSTDPDTHHLIGGHLYTEFSSSSHTIIKRDGKILLKYEGREYLDGLLVRDGDVYTLGVRRSGNGFTCRRNGEVIFDSPYGYVFGSFQESTYPETGGLYEDSGKLCFCYKEYRNGGTACIFKEGLRTMLDAGDGVDLEDVRIFNGDILGVGKNASGELCMIRKGGSAVLRTNYIWDSCRVLCTDTDVHIAGSVSDSSGIHRWSVIVDAVSGLAEEEKEGEYRAFCNGRDVWLEPVEYAGYYCFSKGCICSFGEDRYKALTPKNGCCPVLVKNGMMREIEINGYLTGVEVAVSPSS